MAQLDAVLVSRSDLSAVPFSMERPSLEVPSKNMFRRVLVLWENAMRLIRVYLESWTAAHDDKRIAWTLGIGWACLGGGLAGGCLVFAKAG
jgi:magnesium transporter